MRQPRLQYPQGVYGFFVQHRGQPVPVAGVDGADDEAYVADVRNFVAAHDLPVERIAAGQRKDDVTGQYLAGHDGSEGVLYVGTAQERDRVWTATRQTNPDTGTPCTWLTKTTRLVNYYYFDADFGPFLLQVCIYFPFNTPLIIDGNHWAQQQARKGVPFGA